MRSKFPVIWGDSCKNQKTPEATSPQDLEHSLNFPVSGERHSELLRADTECENSLHISLTSPYKLTDAPPLLERTGPPPPSAHRRRQSSQSLLCAAQVTRALLGRPVRPPSSALLALTAYFCPLRPPPTPLPAASTFCPFAASLSRFTPPSDLTTGHLCLSQLLYSCIFS